MVEPLFDIVFRGDIEAGHKIGEVRTRIKKRFDIDEERLNILFSGRPAILKKSLGMIEADRFAATMLEMGAVVEVRKAAILGSKTVPRDKLSSKYEEKSHTTPEKPLKTIADKANLARITDVRLDVLPTGFDLLSEKERRKFEDLDVPTDHISVAPPGSDILREDERRKVADRDIDTSHLKIKNQEPPE